MSPSRGPARPARAAVLAALATLLPLAARADEAAIARGAAPWVDGIRAGSDRPSIAIDPLLSLVASRYAAELAGAGVLSHVSPSDGSQALERVLRGGGSALLVGEIIGAGPSLGEICAAWEASPPHRAVVLDERFTHCGYGMASRGSQEVWVVLFAREAIADLAVNALNGRVTITGRLVYPGAVLPRVVDAATGSVESLSSWDPVDRSFVCEVLLREARGHWLLGCLTTAGEALVTDSVTWPPAAAPGVR